MAMLQTADGRDLSQEEWRRIPEFPKYVITADGDIRNVRTGKLLNEIERASDGVCYYSLWKLLPNGKQKAFNRAWQGLVYSAFPELMPEKPPPSIKRPYLKRGKWLTLEAYPKFEVHASGTVRYIASRKHVPVLEDVKGAKYVVLRNEEGAERWTPAQLTREVFGKEPEE